MVTPVHMLTHAICPSLHGTVSVAVAVAVAALRGNVDQVHVSSNINLIDRPPNVVVLRFTGVHGVQSGPCPTPLAFLRSRQFVNNRQSALPV